MSQNSEEKNVMLYFLAGVGIGALIGAAAGLLLAPKSGAETREDLSHKFDELKSKFNTWVAQRQAGKKSPLSETPVDEIGA